MFVIPLFSVSDDFVVCIRLDCEERVNSLDVTYVRLIGSMERANGWCTFIGGVPSALR